MGLHHGHGNQNVIAFLTSGNRNKYKMIMFETLRDCEPFYLEEKTIDIAKVLCVKHFLNKTPKPLPFPFSLITLRSSYGNLICSRAVKSLYLFRHQLYW